MQLPQHFAGPRIPAWRRRLRHAANYVAIALLSAVTLGGLGTGSYLYGLWASLPQLTAKSLAAEQSIRVLDASGEELYRIVGDEDRTSLPWDEIPAHVKSAIIAVEDERFYARGCIDPEALARAVMANANGEQVQGASTITQQLARNIFFTPDKTWGRKIRELMLACRMEEQYAKDDILRLYLNWIAFGHNAYGVERAAQQYFGIPAREISVAQAAVLAALPQRPSYFSPYGGHRRTVVNDDALARLKDGSLRPEDLSPDDVRIGLLGATIETASGSVYVGGRSDQVLENMERLGYLPHIVRAQAQEELKTISFRPRATEIDAPHFVFLVRDEVERLGGRNDDADWASEGLSVRTTLDPKLQAAAQKTVERLFPAIGPRFGARNVALVALDRATRKVVAYVGNADYFDDEHEGKIDMARAPRQPGSSFKPLVYAAYLKTGRDPWSVIWDTPLTIGNDHPKNYDGTFHGPMSLSKALAGSRNIPAIRAFEGAGGEGAVVDLAASMGISSPWRRKEEAASAGRPMSFGWPMALGSAEVPLLEMVQGYATLADNGVYKPLVTIEEIKNARGKVIYAPSRASAPTRVLDERVAQDITAILSTPDNRPAGWWRAQMHLPGGLQAAIKTGTSNLCFRRTSGGTCVSYGVNNVWAMGYTPDLVVGVWIGNADNAPLQPKADGLNVAIPLWKDFVIAAQEIRPGALAFSLDKATKAPARPRMDGIARNGNRGAGDQAPSWLQDVMTQIAERSSRNKRR